MRSLIMDNPMDKATPNTIFLSDYLPPDYLIDTIDLDVNLAPRGARVVERLSIRPNPELDVHGPLRLDGEHLKLVSLVMDGDVLAPSEYTVTDTSLTISAPPTDPFNLVIEVSIDPQDNTALSGLYLSSGTYCTQCEAEGFRRIAYALDRPDVLSVYTVRVEGPLDTCPVLLSNGNLIESGKVDGSDRHFATWHDPHPKPTYLFALVGGTLACNTDSFTTASGREVELRIYVEPGKEADTGFAMEALKLSMSWDETAYGREYDLDIFMIVAVSDFNMGAMENKGLNVFNDKLILASPLTATDDDYERIEAVIAHEYFHNWTGNRITCRDWFQLCLKEGLTVFRDQDFTRDVRKGAVKRIEDVRSLRSRQFTEDAGPLSHPTRPASYIEINNFYTATIYEKGAELIRMLHTMLGAEKYRLGTDLYFERHDGEAARVEDLVGALADGGGRDFSEFLKWYDQAGTPHVKVEAEHDAKTETLKLTLHQSTPATPGQSEKQALHMPFAIGMIDGDGNELPLVEADAGKLDGGVLELTNDVNNFTFTGVKSAPVLSLNRNFSAPITLESPVSEDGLLALFAHDSDAFNRWQAGQSLGVIASRAAMDGDLPGWLDEFADALCKIISDESLPLALRAAMLQMPTELDIAREIGKEIDTDAIYKGRGRFMSAIAKTAGSALHQVRERCHTNEAFSPNAEAAGRRALDGAALKLMVHGAPDGAQMALKAYQTADNMTDMMAGLGALTHKVAPEREEALEDFYQRHKDNPLVVDKWLTLHAVSAKNGTAANIQQLTDHTAFTFTNPNRVRALLGAFSLLNQVSFNAADGSGYALIADATLTLDKINPQVAARLLGAFKSWKSLEKNRRDLAKSALTRIADTKDLSPDVYEIATKSLV